jgi:uncharacterized metal-binding protein
MNSPQNQDPPANQKLPLIYTCSGCSDVGELADRIGRELARQGLGEMCCLAGIGGRIKHFMAQAENAARILVIDGCVQMCARRTLELAGFSDFEHLGLNYAGLRKGHCPVTDEHVAQGVAKATDKLQKMETLSTEPQSRQSAGAASDA